MESRISIEVDFDNGNRPVIQILHRESDDTRDSLISHFLQSRAHLSRWITIQYKGDKNGSPYYHLHPVTPADLPSEIKLMQVLMAETGNTPPVKPLSEGTRPRNRRDLMSDAESAITEAMYRVEEVGASLRLTEAVMLLEKARNLVYDHIEFPLNN